MISFKTRLHIYKFLNNSLYYVHKAYSVLLQRLVLLPMLRVYRHWYKHYQSHIRGKKMTIRINDRNASVLLTNKSLRRDGERTFLQRLLDV